MGHMAASRCAPSVSRGKSRAEGSWEKLDCPVQLSDGEEVCGLQTGWPVISEPSWDPEQLLQAVCGAPNLPLWNPEVGTGNSPLQVG